MPSLGYILATVIIAGLITLALRALPFAILKPLRKSKVVRTLGQWMPAGLLLILAVVMLSSEVSARPSKLWVIAIALSVTVGVHLLAGRRALISIFAGTGTYVLLLNLL